MDMSIYFTIGFIFEVIVLLGYIMDFVNFGCIYSWDELLIGFIVDIIAWPIIVTLNIIFIIKSR